MTLKKLIKILIFGVILIPILLVMYFINSFIFHEKGEVLKYTSFKEYNNYIKKEYQDVKALDTYYRFGRITFDFKVKELNDEEFYKIIKETKKFVMEINKDEFAYTQATLRVTFKCGSYFYEFESPHWIQHSDGDIALPSTENNYEIWYKTVNGEGNEKLTLN
ncbi:hypothetical protein [uncultured Clostridium sp.]|uniref:hypothetical protein n=1 Tax=uncultured Clostridium sp. TaxID=59620 RepID=UPI00280B465B|nr:hypothetical protein [uncultured Clostridium sp.]